MRGQTPPHGTACTRLSAPLAASTAKATTAPSVRVVAYTMRPSALAAMCAPPEWCARLGVTPAASEKTFDVGARRPAAPSQLHVTMYPSSSQRTKAHWPDGCHARWRGPAPSDRARWRSELAAPTSAPRVPVAVARTSQRGRPENCAEELRAEELRAENYAQKIAPSKA